MAEDGKKDIKVELDFDPMKELAKDGKALIDSMPAVKKKFAQKVKWSEKAEVDPRKHTKKSLDEEIEQAARFPFQLLATRVGEVAKDKEKDKKYDEKKAIKLLIGYLDEATDHAISNASKKLEDIVSGKADNAKALKDGKAALGKLGKLDFKKDFVAPRADAITAMKELEGRLTKDPGGKAKAFEKARSAIDKIASDFDKSGKEATAAIDYLLKTAKKIAGDDKPDPALSDFAKSILKGKDEAKGPLEDFGKSADELGKIFDKTAKNLKANTMEPDEVKKLREDLEGLSNIASDAKTVETLVEELQREFKKIENKLK
ncbi:MAG: hypothetical protein ACK4GO_00010 [Gemmobacter sp.]